MRDGMQLCQTKYFNQNFMKQLKLPDMYIKTHKTSNRKSPHKTGEEHKNQQGRINRWNTNRRVRTAVAR